MSSPAAGRRRIGSLVRGAVALSVPLLIGLATLELGLRLVPSAVPAVLLVDFDPAPREAIAKSRDLPTIGDTIPLARTDGGPPLRLWKPHARVFFPFRHPGAIKTVVTDEIGFCNRDGSYTRNAHFDLVTLGDSFTWCHAVRAEEAWAHLLAVAMGRTAYNLGRSGVGPYEYLQILERYGLAKTPSVVVMNIYEGNDLRDALRYWSHRGQHGSKASKRAAGEAHRSLLSRHSYAFNLLRSGAAYLRSRIDRKLHKASEANVDFRYRIHYGTREVLLNDDNGDRDEVVHARHLRAGEVGFEVLDGALARFVELSHAHAFLPVVAYTPSAYTAYASRVTFHDPALAELMPWYSAAQREYFRRQAESLGFVFVDLTDALQAAVEASNADALIYDPDTVHLTLLGNRVVASALAAELGPRLSSAPRR